MLCSETFSVMVRGGVGPSISFADYGRTGACGQVCSQGSNDRAIPVRFSEQHTAAPAAAKPAPVKPEAAPQKPQPKPQTPEEKKKEEEKQKKEQKPSGE
jgi:hypothetical protein